MNQTVQKRVRNVSSRLVSFACNSGGYVHLVPNVSVDLDSVETDQNAMLARLKESGTITIVDVEKKKSKRKTTKKSTKKTSKKASKKKAGSKKKKTTASKKKSS